MKNQLRRMFVPVLVLAFALAACSPGAAGGGASSSGGGGTSLAYGKTTLPANPVDNVAGQTYQVGQLVKDPSSGAVIMVTGVRYDSTLPGLSAGQTYALIDILVGNAGTDTVSVSSMLSFSVKSNGSTEGFGLGGLIELLGAKVLTPDNQLDLDLAPGEAFHGLLPVAIPDTATGLVLTYTPTTTAGMVNPISIDLGK